MPDIDFNYQLANAAGYKFDIVKIGNSNYDDLSFYHKENFPDVKINRVNTDMSLLHNKALMTVNGFIYPTDMDTDNLYIPNATYNMLRSRSNKIGIYSFNKLQDNLTKTPITVDMISSDGNIPLYQKSLITFSSPVNSIILVIAGYLVFESPEFLYRVSPTTFALRLDKLMYIERLYELQKYRDIFEELGLPVSPNNPEMIDATLAKSDATILKFLSLNNSFLVEVPVDTLTVEKIYLEHSNVPGNFRTEIEPIYPILVGYGKIGEYLKKKNNDTKYTVYLEDAYYNNYLISGESFTNVNVYNAHRVVGNTYKLTQGFFLKVTGQV
jgi:hypothetical protein